LFDKVLLNPSYYLAPKFSQQIYSIHYFLSRKKTTGGIGYFTIFHSWLFYKPVKSSWLPFFFVLTCTLAGCCRILRWRHHNAHNTYYFPGKTMDRAGRTAAGLATKRARRATGSIATKVVRCATGAVIAVEGIIWIIAFPFRGPSNSRVASQKKDA
jgi:hypothetical protein